MNISQTERIYYQDAHLAKLQAKILRHGQDERGFFFVPDRTIFHPQGGGQPNDEGFVEVDSLKCPIVDLKEEGEEIFHYVSKENGEAPLSLEKSSTPIRLNIDLEKRILFSRYHSGGHFLASIVHKEYPQLTGYKGNHFPGQAFVIFEHDKEVDTHLPSKEDFENKIKQLLEEALKMPGSMIVDNKHHPRTVRFEGYEETNFPCGGTHVRNREEMGKIEIRNVKFKKGEFRVGYNMM